VAGYLTDKFFYDVDSRTRSRGQAYFSAGAVRKLSGDEWSVEAKVQGSRLYEVDIFRLENSFESSCSCPYYDGSSDICKHIWATFLAAEKTGYLKGDDDNRWFHNAPGIGEIFPQKEPRLASREEPKTSDWRRQLERLAGVSRETPSGATTLRQDRQLLYLVQVRETLDRQKLTIGVSHRDRRKDGGWGKIKRQRLRPADIVSLPDEADRRILTLLHGASQSFDYRYSYYDAYASQFLVNRPAWDVVLPLMCATGRCLLQRAPDRDPEGPLEWDAGDEWEFCLRAKLDEGENDYQISGILRRARTEMTLGEPDLLIAGGLVFRGGRIASLQDHGAFSLIGVLRERNVLIVPRREGADFLAQYLSLWQRPPLELPDDLGFQETAPKPKPLLSIKKSEPHPWLSPRLMGELAFDYDGDTIASDAPGPGVFRKNTRVFVRRDRDLEQALIDRLARLGFRTGYPAPASGFSLAPSLLPRVARVLVSEGWQVEAQGQLFRTAGAVHVEINSGVDWFEVSGGVDFGDISVPLPRLLAALKRGEQTVALGDGIVGILPDEWSKKYGMLAELGNAEQNHLRFYRHQAGLLDALIAAEPEVKADEVFERLRNELRNFTGIEIAEAPLSFTGQLRDYQREGLGWLNFLRRFGFGGCLADDMGLGKTVQALALLETRRTAREQSSPGESSPRASLVVVPRSLVFHWKREAERFAPELRVLDHTGAARRKPGAHFAEFDVVLTTYGTLRRDALAFKDQRFDYCILDEAQAIKNSTTLSAKAARLLRADHRLAMSGTPVENHLGELWSLFEFLNPGMLGGASLFGGAGRNPDAATREILSRALRPFILRRTKEQVARELPEKTEQTLYCDLEPREKRLYDELRDYYRARLLKNADGQDMSKIKFQALEALLRLRQAACHPGLIDKKKTAEPSAKVDTLIAQLDQVIDEGHKVLVFSQFTSLLAIVRQRLDSAGIRYAYLDGRTRDRQARVDDFQKNPDLKLFLISLKAGGLGLNLHAAEYVYLLDPWWNPAVEAQAIDRAHRIGQTRQVFAYRLIARDTVEEKVLELQRTKRDLADGIVTGNNSLIKTLTREDLQLLLS
jgi:superfamily II DNA or RNA helicase